MPTKDQLIKLVNYMREYMTAFPGSADPGAARCLREGRYLGFQG